MVAPGVAGGKGPAVTPVAAFAAGAAGAELQGFKLVFHLDPSFPSAVGSDTGTGLARTGGSRPHRGQKPQTAACCRSRGIRLRPAQQMRILSSPPEWEIPGLWDSSDTRINHGQKYVAKVRKPCYNIPDISRSYCVLCVLMLGL